jgi:hypothetical protein
MGKVLIFFKKTYAFIFEIMIMAKKKTEQKNCSSRNSSMRNSTFFPRQK